MNRILKLTPCSRIREQYPLAVNHCGFVSVLEDKYFVSLTDISIFGSFAPAHLHFGSYDTINVEEEGWRTSAAHGNGPVATRTAEKKNPYIHLK